MRHRIVEIQGRLYSELSHRLFFQIQSNRKDYFDKPTLSWQEVIKRFPDTIRDIEEMGRCFALCRYAAAVFHSVQVVESGLLVLGRDFLAIKDPNSGFTAVANELKRIINKKYGERSDFEQRHFSFIEQIQGTVEALKNAWRNKISHSQGRLILLGADFVPDIAEEIIIATRAFMRRLSEEMPYEN